jgi:hypothetical protein
MPDPDKSADERKSARSRRRAPVIELKAEDVSPVQAPVEAVAAAEVAHETVSPAEALAAIVTPAEAASAPEPQITDPQPEPQTEPRIVLPPPPPKPSMGIPLALAAILGTLFGGIGGMFAPRILGSGAASEFARLGALERSQQDLSKQLPGLTSTADLEKVRQSLTRLEADVAKRVTDATTPISQKITGLEAEVKAIAARPASPGAAPAAPPVDLAPVQQRIAALEAQLKVLDAKADAAAKAADPKLAALDQKVDQANRRIEAGSAAPLFAATQALAQAFHRGGPYASEITAAEVLGAKPEQLQPLKAFAEKGAPTPQALASSFAPLAARLAGTADQGGISGFLQRFVAVRPTGETAGDTPPALVGTIEAALRRGDVTAAMATWARLPEPARTLSASWAAQAGDRDKAAKALSALQDAAVAALRK